MGKKKPNRPSKCRKKYQQFFGEGRENKSGRERIFRSERRPEPIQVSQEKKKKD